tara:strand:+ start:3339 stop:3935 length:597 start_codon:yes stop_codon:yes gene_type:complete
MFFRKSELVGINKKVIETGILFIHIPKTAGVSISKQLYDGLIGHKGYYYYKKKFSYQQYTDLYKFSVVRHPFSRFISSYNYLKNGGLTPYDREFSKKINNYDNVDSFLQQNHKTLKRNLHFKSQHTFIFRRSKKQVNDIFKIEELNDFELFFNLKLNVKISYKLNCSPNKNETTISQESKDILRDIYKNDFRLLRYEK